MKSLLNFPIGRTIIILLALIFSSTAQSQLDNYELFDIIKLYNEEQYDVVIGKLKSKGFEIIEATPDYTLNGIENKGIFFMAKAYEWFSSYGKEVEWSRFNFNTQILPSYKTTYFKFNLVYTTGNYSYLDIVKRLEIDIGSKPEYCVDSTCAKFYDTRTFWGKNVEEPGQLISAPRPSTYFSVRYSTSPLHKSFPEQFQKEITYVYADAFYSSVKFPIENLDDYLANPIKYKNFISIPIKQKGGVHTVEINIGGENYIYIIDSGASEMVILKSMETRLLDLGILRSSDYLPSKTFTLADGTQKTFRRVKLSSVRIVDLKIEDLIVAIVDDNSPLLLGKSFLDKFKSWKINNFNSTLEFTR